LLVKAGLIANAVSVPSFTCLRVTYNLFFV
jgi:hypothetical protein